MTLNYNKTSWNKNAKKCFLKYEPLKPTKNWYVCLWLAMGRGSDVQLNNMYLH